MKRAFAWISLHMNTMYVLFIFLLGAKFKKNILYAFYIHGNCPFHAKFMHCTSGNVQFPVFTVKCMYKPQ